MTSLTSSFIHKPARRWRISLGAASTGALVVVGLLVLLTSIAVSITLGAADISLVNVRDIVTNHLGLTNIPVRVSEDAIVWQDRMPRALVAAGCGIGLSLCGLILQTLLRNALADPYILGVSSGASTGAVVIGMLGLGAGAIGVSGGAFIGSLIAFAVVMLMMRFMEPSASGFVLAGVASTQLFSALTSLAIFAFADSDEARGVMFWLLGSLEGVRWTQVWLALAASFLCLTVAIFCAQPLDALIFGEEMAHSLGVNVRALKLTLLLLTALVTAVLVSVAGAIGFVGLVIPHAVRLMGKNLGHLHQILLCSVVGATFMVWIDALTRVLFSPTALPIGVGTALFGVPAFIVILMRRKVRM